MPDTTTTMPFEDWARRGRVLRDVDGDTLLCLIDLGHGVTITRRVRLLGINAFDKSKTDADQNAKAESATLAAQQWIAALPQTDWPILLQTRPARQDDKYGRYLAYIWNAQTGEQLNATLLAAGHAVVMRGLPLEEP